MLALKGTGKRFLFAKLISYVTEVEDKMAKGHLNFSASQSNLV